MKNINNKHTRSKITNVIRKLQNNGYKVHLSNVEGEYTIYFNGYSCKYTSSELIKHYKYIISNVYSDNAKKLTKHSEHRKSRSIERTSQVGVKGERVLDDEYYDENYNTPDWRHQADIWTYN